MAFIKNYIAFFFNFILEAIKAFHYNFILLQICLHRSNFLVLIQMSHSAAATPVEERGSSADGMVQAATEPSTPTSSKFSTHSLPRHHSSSRPTPPCTSTIPRSKIVRVTSDPTLSPCVERRRFEYLDDPEPGTGPPPKPSRVPSLVGEPSGSGTRGGVYHASGSDSGNGSGDSVQSSADTADAMSVSMRGSVGVVIKNPSRSYSPPESVEPELEPASAFDLDNFGTLLLPTLENKPLDSTALQGVKMMLAETGPRLIANHLTKVDLELAHAAGSSQSPPDLGLGVNSGIELCALPHGHQLRLDLIERYVMNPRGLTWLCHAALEPLLTKETHRHKFLRVSSQHFPTVFTYRGDMIYFSTFHIEGHFENL